MEERGRRGVCTRLYAPGVPCGPGSGKWREGGEDEGGRGGVGPHLHLKLSNEIHLIVKRSYKPQNGGWGGSFPASLLGPTRV